MNNEADIIILFVSHDNESFTLLKFGQISICQNQNLKIPISTVYKAPDVQLTTLKYISFTTDICHEFHDAPFNPDS